jgi:hypothetical protein
VSEFRYIAWFSLQDTIETRDSGLRGLGSARYRYIWRADNERSRPWCFSFTLVCGSYTALVRSRFFSFFFLGFYLSLSLHRLGREAFFWRLLFGLLGYYLLASASSVYSLSGYLWHMANGLRERHLVVVIVWLTMFCLRCVISVSLREGVGVGDRVIE